MACMIYRFIGVALVMNRDETDLDRCDSEVQGFKDPLSVHRRGPCHLFFHHRVFHENKPMYTSKDWMLYDPTNHIILHYQWMKPPVEAATGRDLAQVPDVTINNAFPSLENGGRVALL